MFMRSVLSLGVFVATVSTACSSTTQQSAPVAVSPAQAKVYCSGGADQTASAADVLSRPGLVEAVYEDRENEQWGHNTVSLLKGAKIMLRPEPGISRPLLGRAMQCRIMDSSSLLANNDTDPLSIGHADVRVMETDTGYMVVIRSQKEDDAREIVRRAKNLFARSVARAQSNADTSKVSVR